MDCSSGTALFVVVAGALILALSAFLRSKEVKKAEGILRIEVERLRHLVTRLEMRVHDLESGGPSSEIAEAIPAPAEPEPETVRTHGPAPIPEPAPPPIPASIDLLLSVIHDRTGPRFKSL